MQTISRKTVKTTWLLTNTATGGGRERRPIISGVWTLPALKQRFIRDIYRTFNYHHLEENAHPSSKIRTSEIKVADCSSFNLVSSGLFLF